MCDGSVVTADGVEEKLVGVCSMCDGSVVKLIEEKLNLFHRAIVDTHSLRIDGYIDDVAKKEEGFPKDLMNAPEGFKIDNSALELSVVVPVQTVIETSLEALIEALRTFEFTKVHGVTRIVGYYSRVANWNKSKVGELRDRHNGNYGVKPSVAGHTER